MSPALNAETHTHPSPKPAVGHLSQTSHVLDSRTYSRTYLIHSRPLSAVNTSQLDPFVPPRVYNFYGRLGAQAHGQVPWVPTQTPWMPKCHPRRTDGENSIGRTSLRKSRGHLLGRIVGGVLEHQGMDRDNVELSAARTSEAEQNCSGYGRRGTRHQQRVPSSAFPRGAKPASKRVVDNWPKTFSVDQHVRGPGHSPDLFCQYVHTPAPAAVLSLLKG